CAHRGLTRHGDLRAGFTAAQTSDYFGALFIFSFFFSSRRRHTSSKRDWSSDVCSSDLYTQPYPHFPCHAQYLLIVLAIPLNHHRSEERRVGKEGRFRRGQMS